MNVVQLPQPGVSGKAVKGRGLVAQKLGKAARAVLVAEVAEGSVTLTDLSLRQIAAVVGVSTAYAGAALKLTASLEKPRSSRRSLTRPKRMRISSRRLQSRADSMRSRGNSAPQ
jgi:hypothetical protein